MKTLLLIDANSLIHRAFHALPPLTTAEGEPGNALYGVSSILLKLWREERPEYAAACFDRPEATFRKEQVESYKAQRPETPDDLLPQIIAARDLFPQFGIRTFEAAGFEADDLIGTLACAFADAPDLRVEILTGDRDTLQLVRGDKVVVRVPQKGISETFTYDEAAIKEKYGLAPAQLIDYKALVGDPSDNIKGVTGIGPKTAQALLQKFGTLDGALARAGDDPLAGRLRGHEEVAKKAQWLVTIKCDIPVGVKGIEDLKVDTNEELLGEFFVGLGFPSLAKRLRGNGTKEVKEKKPATRQGSIF